MSEIAFGLTCGAVLLSPWFFAAWEVWWFWPFVVGIFAACLFFALSLLATGTGPTAPGQGAEGVARSVALALLAFGPFLIYAAIRSLQAEVAYDAERMFLLKLTPLLLACQIVYGFSREQARRLHLLILADLCLLGLYGLINHGITGSRLVLWAPGYAQYWIESRASGSYFCPDHFAGIMELALCLAIALLAARETRRSLRLLSVLTLVIALAGIVLSKSRGGGVTVIVIFGAALAWGFGQWPRHVRWYLRGAALAVAGLGLIVFCSVAAPYLARFTAYVGWTPGQGVPLRDVQPMAVLAQQDRVQMAAAALRAWKDAPWLGIGPGMHQNLWPHYAATPDGDRAAFKWPSMLNNKYHSYEVHSDWIQLLEEYGVAGMALFLLGAFATGVALTRSLRIERRRIQAKDWDLTGRETQAFVLGALLAGVAMAFHSIGDFNLQMPATVWLLAAVLGIGGRFVRSAEA